MRLFVLVALEAEDKRCFSSIIIVVVVIYDGIQLIVWILGRCYCFASVLMIDGHAQIHVLLMDVVVPCSCYMMML